MWRQSWLAAVLVLAPAFGADAPVKLQPRAPRPVPVGVRAPENALRVTSQRVVVPVTVLDGKGAPVLGLSRDRFRLFEDGVEQTIQTLGQDDAPVSIGIVFDASRSMEPKLAQAREAVAELFADSMPNDEFHLVEFNSSPRLLCDLTKDTKEVRRALDTVKAQGWTALFDGIMLATKKMRAATNSRRALVILSDGGDNFSRYQESEVRSYLREAGVVVFAVTLGGGPAATHETRHLRRLSRETGGWAYGVGDLEKMAGVVRAIGKAIRTQYTLTYAPVNTPSDGKFHRIAIQLAPPKDPGLAASWRDGYYAAEMQ